MITSEQLKAIINDHQKRARAITDQAAYMQGKNPSILAAYPKEEPDNRIPVPFARRAINVILGYMFKDGNITYIGDGYDDALKETLDRNDEGLLDLELGATACAHGEAYELHWSIDGQDYFAQVPIAQCIPIWDDAIVPRMIGFIRYWCKDREHHAQVYDEYEMQAYIDKTGSGAWMLESLPIKHGYGRVPIVRFTIAQDSSNVFDHVTELIDLYDRIISEDFANELARFASSYLLMAGQLSDEADETTGETQIERIKQTRAFMGLGSERSVMDSVAFLTKGVNDAFLNSAADRTERLIYEMMQLFNPNDQQFATASGIAQKYKLLGFEYLCTGIATYFSIGLQDRIALIKGLTRNMSAEAERIEYVGGRRANTDVTIKWQRNLPDDLAQLADIAAKLKGVLSDETIIRLFPSYVVENVEEELAKLDSMPDIFATPASTAPVEAENPEEPENEEAVG